MTAGAIHVTVETEGVSPGSQGYRISIGDVFTGWIGPNTVETFPGLSPGQYELTLTGVDATCRTSTPNPLEVLVVADDTTLSTFEVVCPLAGHDIAASSTGIAFASNRGGQSAFEIYVTHADGSAPVRLTEGTRPAWSPDGTRIAFEMDSNLYLANADGSDRTQLTDRGEDGSPAWSPNGTRLAFSRDVGGDWNPELYIMRSDGSDPTRITTELPGGSGPAWSPDGTRIAYGRGMNIYVANADGSNPVKITNESRASSWGPEWSPDGSMIAFSRSVQPGGETDVYAMHPDGSQPVNLTDHPGHDHSPTWSPDGTQIAFTSGRDGNSEVYVMDSDGSNPVNVTQHPASDVQPAW